MSLRDVLKDSCLLCSAEIVGIKVKVTPGEGLEQWGQDVSCGDGEMWLDLVYF